MNSKKLSKFSTSLSTPQSFFSTIGLTLFENDKKKINSRWYYIKFTYFWIQYISLFACLIGEFIYFFTSLGSFKNFLAMIETTSYIGFVALSLIKLLIVFIHRENLLAVIDDLNELFPGTTELQTKYRVEVYMNRTNYLMKYFAILYMILIWIFNLLPIIESYMGYRKTGIWIRSFPYCIWYPFDALADGVFEVNYIIQGWAGFNSACSSVAVDVLFCAIISQICMQFKILQYDLLNLDIGGQNAAYDIGSLNKCIEKHEKLIQFSNVLEKCYSLPMMINFVASTFIICLTGFMAVTGAGAFDLFKFFLFLISSLTEIFVLCWYGNRIMDYVSGNFRICYHLLFLFIIIYRVPVLQMPFIIQTG